MPLVPYVEDVESIMNHFMNGPGKGIIKKIKQNPTTSPTPTVEIKLVSPVQQTLEMAEASMKKQKKKKNPWV